MRRTVLLLALCACASGGSAFEETTAKQTQIYSSPETGILLGERPRAVGTTIAAAPLSVWLAAKKTYLDLEIPLVVENPSTHQMGNANFYKSRQIGGRSMTEFVDCGSGMTGPKAATYRIYISLLTEIMTDGQGGTKIQTTFVPIGQDMAGNSTDRIPCGTTGRFESFFLDRIKANLGKA